MQYLLLLLILGSSISFIAPAPKNAFYSPFEQAMMNQLHKPLYTVDIPPEHPRKGEYRCKGGICRTKTPCDGCQGAVPLDTNWEYNKPWD